VFVALLPWLAALDRARTLRASVGTALVFSLAFCALVFPWFPQAIANYTGAPTWVGWVALLVLAPAIEPQLFAFALVRRLAPRGIRAALAGACAWVGAEWAVPKLFADSLGHAFLPAPWLRQAVDLAGVGGLTFVVLLANESLWAAARALAARRPTARSADGQRAEGERRWAPAMVGRPRAALAPIAAAVALIGSLATYGAVRLRALEAEIARAPRIAAGIVQADIARYGELARSLGSFDAVANILEAHFALSHEALAQGELDLLLWPETVYPTTFGAPKSEDGAAFDRAIGAFVTQTGVALLFGAYDAEGGRDYNAAVLLEPDGPERVRFAAYRKAALFPLTERVPAWLDGPRVRALLPWLGTWTPPEGGERTLALGSRSVRVAPLICYDALDPALARAAVREGAELFAMLSNDSWFAVGAGPRLHLAMAAFRSLETHRAQLRATPTGISALVLPTGEIEPALGVHARGALVVRAPLLSGPPTPFVRFGDWLGPVAALAALPLALLGRARRV
jgi:apolipoprotein N-acyltransferase